LTVDLAAGRYVLICNLPGHYSGGMRALTPGKRGRHHPRTRGGDRGLAEPPERAGQPEIIEDLLVLLARVRLPRRVESIAPPGVGELGELGDRDRRTGRAPGEPSVDVVFRPEEQHRASGETDVLPPGHGRHENVEDQRRVIRSAVTDDQTDGLVTVGALGLDDAIDVQR